MRFIFNLFDCYSSLNLYMNTIEWQKKLCKYMQKVKIIMKNKLLML